jgi:transcription-repair coupling factor (superfamily II helicase)
MDGSWRELAERLRTSDPFTRLRERVAAGAAAAADLPIPAAAWVCDLLARDLERPLFVLLPRDSDALAWLEAMRLFAGGEGIYFSAPSLSPYVLTEVSLLVRSEEAVALDALVRGTARTVVSTPRALFRRLPSAQAFLAQVEELGAGSEVEVEGLAARLAERGYERRDLVSEVGEYAVRGGVFDLFPPGEPDPVRLDLFGDSVESVRRFSADDQRSRDELERVRILPLSLFPAGVEEARRLAGVVASAAVGPEAAELVEALREKGGFAGWENLLPAFAPETSSLLELLPGALTVLADRRALEQEVELHAKRLASDFEARRAKGIQLPPPDAVERTAREVASDLASSRLEIETLESSAAEPVSFQGSRTDLLHNQLPRFPREVETATERRERLVVVAQPEHRNRIERLCETYELTQGPGGVEIVEGELARGFRLPGAGLVVFGEPQLFKRVAPERRAFDRRRGARLGPFLSGLRDLRVGEHVVHSEHGIGRYVGLKSLGRGARSPADLPPALRAVAPDGAGGEIEVMEIVYSAGRSLFVPLSRLDSIERYSGIEGVAPRLDDLGGTSWSRAKERVRKGVLQLATDLLKLYAERQLAKAPRMGGESDLQRQFEAAFEYDETADQLQAVAAISEDLAGERPMDRLLCGDVGFGKTEVAMRAAFKAVESGYQVVVLAPTTILADQHLETFRRRFAGFPVKVDMISRFRTPAEIRSIRDQLKGGEMDILIGTHRLLSRDIEVPKLGLMIVDEEQRFGVAQKENLKLLKKDVHVLALTATPVPRTLQLALAGVRDLSVIETAPRDRLAVETAIVPFTHELVREAIEDELERGGQVYYVYNRVDGIERIARYLRDLVPALRLTIGHGQLEEAELARRMHAFKAGEYDLLLATTIIENGIDISNVNTMIVHRADRFGLAQLYQLRGRVGRSNVLAYCYLTIPPDRVLSEVARQRLAALREFTDLGAGFRVAARDLEIRGAGNLLGAEQSGHIVAVGIEAYLKMLDETVRELKGETVEREVSAAIDLPVSAAIPPEYLEDANVRMEIYRKIASSDLPEEELLAELRDRFGPPPPPVLRLLEVAALKRVADRMRVQSISAKGGEVRIRFRRDSPVDVDRLIELVSDLPGASFTPSGVLALAGLEGGRLVHATRAALERLQG